MVAYIVERKIFKLLMYDIYKDDINEHGKANDMIQVIIKLKK